MTRETSSDLRLRRFERSLKRRIVANEALKSHPSLASTPTASTAVSVHTLIEFLPYRAEFQAAGLAVTSKDQRRRAEVMKKLPKPPLPDDEIVEFSSRPINPHTAHHYDTDSQTADTGSSNYTVVSFASPYELPPPKNIYTPPSPSNNPARKTLPWLRKQPGPLSTSTAPESPQAPVGPRIPEVVIIRAKTDQKGPPQSIQIVVPVTKQDLNVKFVDTAVGRVNAASNDSFDKFLINSRTEDIRQAAARNERPPIKSYTPYWGNEPPTSHGIRQFEDRPPNGRKVSMPLTRENDRQAKNRRRRNKSLPPIPDRLPAIGSLPPTAPTETRDSTVLRRQVNQVSAFSSDSEETVTATPPSNRPTLLHPAPPPPPMPARPPPRTPVRMPKIGTTACCDKCNTELRPVKSPFVQATKKSYTPSSVYTSNIPTSPSSPSRLSPSPSTPDTDILFSTAKERLAELTRGDNASSPHSVAASIQNALDEVIHRHTSPIPGFSDSDFAKRGSGSTTYRTTATQTRRSYQPRNRKTKPGSREFPPASPSSNLTQWKTDSAITALSISTDEAGESTYYTKGGTDPGKAEDRKSYYSKQKSPRDARNDDTPGEDLEINDKDIFRGLQIALAAACDPNVDEWIKEVSGTEVRQFLANLRVFEDVGELVEVARKAAARKKRGERKLREKEAKDASRMNGHRNDKSGMDVRRKDTSGMHGANRKGFGSVDGPAETADSRDLDLSRHVKEERSLRLDDENEQRRARKLRELALQSVEDRMKISRRMKGQRSGKGQGKERAVSRGTSTSD